jgi:hypothetical protein
MNLFIPNDKNSFYTHSQKPRENYTLFLPVKKSETEVRVADFTKSISG